MAYDSNGALRALGRFTSEQAINDTRKKIRLTYAAAEKIAKQHSVTLTEFINETGFQGDNIPAYTLFAWLGY